MISDGALNFSSPTSLGKARPFQHYRHLSQNGQKYWEMMILRIMLEPSMVCLGSSKDMSEGPLRFLDASGRFLIFFRILSELGFSWHVACTRSWLGALPRVDGEGVRSTLLQGHVTWRENNDLVHVTCHENHDFDKILKILETFQMPLGTSRDLLTCPWYFLDLPWMCLTRFSKSSFFSVSTILD